MFDLKFFYDGTIFMQFQKATLDNGLEIIGEINPQAYTAAIGFFVRTGARDETDALSGVSHFLEHMLFKGTPNRTAVDVNRQLDEMGGMANAFTSEEMTVYYASILPELQTQLVDLLTDLLRPSLRADDFETEKKVILEEIKMYEDAPPYGIDEKSREYFFAGHPLSRSVLGTHESVSALTADQMRGYFESRYSSDNITAVVCGNVDFDRFVLDIRQRCDSWCSGAPPRESFRPKGRRGEFFFHRPASTQEYLFQLTDGPSSRDFDRYAAAIFANIVGDDVGSRLFWALVDNGRADFASLSFCDFYDAGFFCASLACAPEDMRANLEDMNQIFAEVQESGITREELDRAKNKLLSRLVMAGERSTGRLFAVGTEWTQTHTYAPIQDDLAIVREMTLERLAAVQKKYPLSDPLTMAVGPLDHWPPR